MSVSVELLGKQGSRAGVIEADDVKGDGSGKVGKRMIPRIWNHREGH